MTSQTGGSAARAVEPRPCRKFSVGDAMILVAGVAFALAVGWSRLLVSLALQIAGLCQTIVAYNTPFFSTRRGLWWNHIWIFGSTVLWYGFRVSEEMLLCMVPIFLLLRLRRPRPRILALFKQPGTVAGLAAIFGLVWVTGWLHRLFVGKFNYWTMPAVAVGCTVAVAWVFLALSRKWEAEPGWIDGMGWLLGAIAIVNGLLAFAMFGTKS